MKKMFFIAFGVLTLTAVGCRQQDEVFGAEEEQSLKVLKKSRQSSQDTKDTINSYGNFGKNSELDGDPAPPPIK